MSRVRKILRNLKLLGTDDFSGHWKASEERDDKLAELLREFERRLEARADAYERAVDARIDERLAAVDRRLDDYQAALDARIDERLAASERALDARFDAFEVRLLKRADAYEAEQTARANTFETEMTARANAFEAAQTARANEFERTVDERLTGFITASSTRADKFEASLTERANNYEKALDERQEERFRNADERLDQRLVDAESRLDRELAAALERIDERFTERATNADIRLDERLVRMERNIDQRFQTLEERTDARMETHERTVDGKLHQRSQDIVDRNDLMLQIFEQRLDRLRREIGALRQSPPPAASQALEQPAEQAPEQPAERASTAPDPAFNGSGATAERSASDQLISFRKMAESGAAALRRIDTGESSLYEQIISWKKIAHQGLDDFTPDERAIADYIMSFVSEEKERSYTTQHLRRFIATLARIPPATSPSDRLLELGSLFHLAPAIKKYCGYEQIFCADYWPGESVVYETLKQTRGDETHTFELRNFNVESDRFPYDDGSFRIVLCCELIEHLRRDPMHMLWECNRVLQDGGYLLLTTPNIASARAIEGLLVGCAPYLLAQYNRTEIADQHNREYAPYEIGVALAAAGFSVVMLETEDVWLRTNPAIIELLRQVQISTELRGDNIFALARKTSAPVERYPKELYID